MKINNINSVYGELKYIEDTLYCLRTFHKFDTPESIDYLLESMNWLTMMAYKIKDIVYLEQTKNYE